MQKQPLAIQRMLALRLRTKWKWLFLFALVATPLLSAEDLESRGVRIQGGVFTPQYGVASAAESVRISPFIIDAVPVSNARYYRFTQRNVQWKKGSPSPLFVDSHYLQHWQVQGGESVPPIELRHSPVVNISWFAAAAFCKSENKRLPTVFEWEFVAAADEKQPDASHNPIFVQRLLDWYSRPNHGQLGSVQSGEANYWGVYNLHGLVWEWVQDFNSVFVGGDNRRDTEQLGNLFCGDAAASSTDRANYAAYMRYALRNSMKASYTMENMGFRCAQDGFSEAH